MRMTMRKGKEARRPEDDSLFGLLSSYKVFNTYFRVLESPSEDKIVLQITDNPANWLKIPKENYPGFKVLRRLEIGVQKLSVKYLAPDHLIKALGLMLGINLPFKKATVTNNIDRDGYYILETSLKFKHELLYTLKKIITLSPQKKYEILEKCLSDTSAG